MCAIAEACVLPTILIVVPFMACDLSLSANQATAVHATLTLGTYRMYVHRYFLIIYNKLIEIIN